MAAVKLPFPSSTSSVPALQSFSSGSPWNQGSMQQTTSDSQQEEIKIFESDPNVQHTRTSSYWLDKPLPPMPREGERTEDHDSKLHYLTESPAANAPPSPLSPASYGRPRAPTPSASDDQWLSSPELSQFNPKPLASIYPADSPLSDASHSISPSLPAHQPLKPGMPLPDPTNFPDPYPYRTQHQHLNNMPPLSSAGSSSTRSSGYTSSARNTLASGDYGHVHVASGDDDSSVGLGITSDSVVQMLANDPNMSGSLRGNKSRAPIDQSRWSESYPTARSRSSSISAPNSNRTSGHELAAPPKLQQQPSFDTGWQAVDERDEAGMSESETDDDHGLCEDDDQENDNDEEEERTSAAVIAEEGRGMIVNGGGLPLAQLSVQPGTTHLLIGSSTTPNAMPNFLTSTLPQISHALLALDISNNFLGALPPVLAVCEHLEELNIASNPLRVLPVFLADLANLRVLIADSTGIATLPESLSHLEKVHTISIRKNKLNALPSWLCLLPGLQTLYVDGNPFQGPWKALVEPLLARGVPMTPVYPPSTPVFPPPTSVSAASSTFDLEPETTDTDDFSETGSPNVAATAQFLSPEEEDHTMTPDRLPPVLGRSVTAPHIVDSERPSARPLTRTRTTPNRAHYDQSRATKSTPATPPNHPDAPLPQESQKPPERPELRKMKSAGELRRGKSAQEVPPRPPLAHYPTSLSSTNLLRMGSGDPGQLNGGKQYGSLGPSALARPNVNGMRPQLTQSLWNNAPEGMAGHPGMQPNRMSTHENAVPPFPRPVQPPRDVHEEKEKHHMRSRSAKDGKDKGGRWGFLKKMSMGKMRVDSSQPLPPGSIPGRPKKTARPHTSGGTQASTPSSGFPTPPPSLSSERDDKMPQIDVRFSTTGILESFAPSLSVAGSAPSQNDVQNSQTSHENTNVQPVLTSPNLLSPPTTQPRAAKRRSFLPIDNPGTLSLSIPPSDTSSRLVAVDDKEDTEAPRTATPLASPDVQQLLRREEERVRENYSRALRSVMAYLRDMHDLGLSQQPNPMSMYGATSEDVLMSRSRRPTMVDGQRDTAVSISASSSTSESGQLRSVDSMAGLRSGTSSQTLSVATTDSSGSSSAEERKWKDDKGKRAMIVREIVATERTYVKGLQELVDIYIKPATLTVNILSGVSTSKDTVVPFAERKVVFGSIEPLFSFHKDSFLPALEVAAGPVMKSSADVQQTDADGQLSISVVKAVGNMFLKHVAFLKMYSTYINNFDNSVQRVKHWTSDKNAPIPPSPAISTTSPSSSTAQLVSLGLSMTAVSSPNLSPDPSNPSGLPPLSSSQRKRIKSYLKRCRLNPRHSQLNLEGYLLLPVQRIPRYRLLLEELVRSTPPPSDYEDDPLERALAEISSLANNMNEGKRESESRRKLVQWQARIRGRFPSPLVQPHRRLIMDGPLMLTRVVRKAMVSFEAINAQGDSSTVQVDCLAPELTPRSLTGVLCNDLLVLCRDPSEGQDPNSAVDLWAVLRMQTLPQPASIVHGNVLRLVDNKAILYFDAPSPSDALNWYRAINLHIPASKT